MKKVLSVAMASAMVLGMGANAFAIQYSTGSNEKASWPKGFAFDGQLFVTNEDGDIIEESTTQLNGNKAVDFQPGDVIWMPLYANDQKVYNVVDNNDTSLPEVSASAVVLKGVENAQHDGEVEIDANGAVKPFTYTDEANKVVYYYNQVKPGNKDGWRYVELKSGDLTTYKNGRVTSGTALWENVAATVKKENITVTVNPEISEEISAFNAGTHTVKFSNNASTVATTGWTKSDRTLTGKVSAEDVAKILKDLNAGGDNYLANETSVTLKFETDNDTIAEAVTFSGIKETNVAGGNQLNNVEVKVRLPKVAAVDKEAGTIKDDLTNNTNVSNTVVSYGHYTGNIDKNWSINLIEKDGTVADLIEKAELYKATAADVTSYNKYTDEVVANGVYLKVTLKDEWKTTDEETLKYYVYVANNKTNEKTNEVWVSGNYAAPYRTVDFTWTNNANKAGLWKAEENGTAVFDFADKAFFTVKMYKGETMYLDLETAYDKAIAGEMDADADSFYKFDKSNANFAREGELVIVTDDDTLVPYEIDEDGNFVELDAEYVKDYAVAHTNAKVNGFKFNTKQLGNYVLSTEELGAEEEVEEPEVDEEEAPEVDEEEAPEVEEVPETNKPNPETGAEDFVGLAVSLAVVSVAAAGALALKK